MPRTTTVGKKRFTTVAFLHYNSCSEETVVVKNLLQQRNCCNVESVVTKNLLRRNTVVAKKVKNLFQQSNCCSEETTVVKQQF